MFRMNETECKIESEILIEPTFRKSCDLNRTGGTGDNAMQIWKETRNGMKICCKGINSLIS